MFEQASIHAIEHAKSCFPNESIGVIIDGTYYPLQNKHDTPQDAFYVPEHVYFDLVQEKGEIQAVIHSHPFRGDMVPRLYPSKSDMQSQKAFNVPFGIICCDKSDAWDIQWFGDSCPMKDFVGRTFIHGVQDCYSLIRDYYRKEHNLVLNDYPRDWNWWENSKDDLYSMFFKDAGFIEVPIADIRKGDGVLMVLGLSAMRTNTVSHGAIYLGNDEILHHKSGKYAYDPSRLSCIEVIYRYRKYIRYVLRHESLI